MQVSNPPAIKKHSTKTIKIFKITGTFEYADIS